MANMSDGEDAPFTLRYGQLEGLLAELLGAPANVIVSRFRKLRPKFAADGLLTETGNHVSYDLTRVLAIAAIYEINSLSIPQGHAVDIVVANWPEIAKACLTAWHDHEKSTRRKVEGRSPLMRIYVDALNASPADGSWVLNDGLDGIPHITVDCRSIVEAVHGFAEQAGSRDQLANAFADLESTFGWERMKESDAHRMPQRSASELFGTGPYFNRARLLLSIKPGQKLGRRRRLHLQTVLDYLEAPVPIDSWKRFIGTEPGEPRLMHMLAAWGLALGLRSSAMGEVAVLQMSSQRYDKAIELIARGEKRAAELAGKI